VTPDQEELFTKAQDSIKAAHLLLTGGFPGFAASRAYYAMFYLASALLEGEGVAFSKHAGVLAAFGRLFVKTGRLSAELHRYLIDAFEARQEGDYAPSPAITRQSAAEHVARAEAFLSAAEALLKTQPCDP
jgi:uncharacterized protein (UPF0332 family)